MPPRDSDGSADDELAQVIPLRRRERERQDRDRDTRESDRVGVSDDPDEPDPTEEYSIWDNPARTLKKREPEGPARWPGLRRAWPSLYRWRALVAVTLVVAGALAGVALALNLGAHHRQPPLALRNTGSSAASSNASRGARARSSVRSSAAHPHSRGAVTRRQGTARISRKRAQHHGLHATPGNYSV